MRLDQLITNNYQLETLLDQFPHQLKLISEGITEYSNSRVSSIGEYVFYSHPNIQSVNFPNVESIGSYAFMNCQSLSSVYLPNLTKAAYYMFDGCISLSRLILPNVERIEGYAFVNCSSLQSVAIPTASYIYSSAFAFCDNLQTLVLGYNDYYGYCTLSDSRVFVGTPFDPQYYGSSTSFSPTIWVPNDYLYGYQTMTNWVYFSRYMRGYSFPEAIYTTWGDPNYQ